MAAIDPSRGSDRIRILSEKVDEWCSRPFAYGSSDCWQFAADVVHALTGVDYRNRFPKYESSMAALRILAAHGGMVGLAESVLGPRMRPELALPGDVVVLELASGPTAGICLGACSAAHGDRGLVFPATVAASAAWRI